MMRFQVLLSLCSVTSCSCIDNIPQVAKTSLKTKEIFFIKVKTLPHPPKTAHLNTPPHVYITVWEDLQNTAQMYTKKVYTCFVVKAKVLCLGFQKRAQLEISG